MNEAMEESKAVNSSARKLSLVVPLVLLVLSAIVYPLWWKSAPLKAEDTAGYQVVAQDLVEHGGFTKMHFRCPGYPLLLALTGSSETLTRGLFLVTLALYLLSVYMLVSMARYLELPAWGTVVLCLLCVTPPFVEPSAYAMTEGLTTVLLVGAMWALIVHEGPALSGVVAGVLIALAAFSRPTYQLLGLVLAGLLLYMRQMRKAVWLAASSSLIIGGFCFFNWVKFDYFAITPALGWSSCTKTAGYVERMPPGDLRDLLVKERNRHLVEGQSHSGTQYIYGLEPEVAKVTGLDGVPLAKYMLSVNKQLILGAPLSYIISVGQALVGYWLPALGMISNCDSRVLQLFWMLVHFGLMAVFFIQLVAIIGTALTRGLAGLSVRLKHVYWMGLVVIFYTMGLSCLLDVGNPRFRVVTDGVLILVTLIGLQLWQQIRSTRLAPINRHDNMKPRCFFIGTPLGELSIMKQFEALARELVKRGHKVIILAPHRKVELARPNDNPAIVIWPSERPTKLRDAWFFYKFVRRYKPDCLVASYAAVNIMMLIGWLTRVPQRIAWYHTLSSQIDLDGHGSKLRLKLLRLRKKLVYRLSTHIVPVSQAACEDVRMVYREPERKLRVFLNAVADPLTATGSNGTEHPMDHVVCIARLFPSKGQDVLLRAIALLKDKHPQLRVEFIGDGPAKDSYTQLARDLGVNERCTFAGSLGHDEVLKRMVMATITVLPSRSDNCPLVTIESLAVGTPVIASRVGGIPEVVRDGIDGFLVPPDDAYALAAKLSQVLANAGLLRELRVNARAGFLSRFEQRGAVREQANWLEAMLSNGRHLSAN